MILPILLTAAIIAAPPSPRAIQERQQTIDRRHQHRVVNRGRGEDVGYYPGYWNDWPVYYPPTAGQLPPGWIEVYGPFIYRMEETSR